MTSIHDFVGGEYLKAADLNGQERTVQLSGFTVETIKGDSGDEMKVVARFAELQKGMVIGAKCVAKVLLGMFASDQIEEWDQRVKQVPTHVVLFTEPTNLGDGLRLRPAPAQSSQPQTQDTFSMTPEIAQQFEAFQKFMAMQQTPSTAAANSAR